MSYLPFPLEYSSPLFSIFEIRTKFKNETLLFIFVHLLIFTNVLSELKNIFISERDISFLLNLPYNIITRRNKEVVLCLVQIDII